MGVGGGEVRAGGELLVASGAQFEKQVLAEFHHRNTRGCRIPEGSISFPQYLDVYCFAIFWGMIILDDVVKSFEVTGDKPVSTSEKRVVAARAVATLTETGDACLVASGKLGHTRGQAGMY